MKILIVEDDRSIAIGLDYALQAEQFQTIVCLTYEDAAKAITTSLNEIDLCLLDLSLPDGSGYDLCKMIKHKQDIPVIFLTAMDDEVNVVMGLDIGADDYITKPFRIRELISRINSVLRRYKKTTQQTIIQIENITIHPLEGKVYKDGIDTVLTTLEYRLFLTLAKHRGQVLSRNQLLEQIWDIAGDFVNDNTLTVYIKRLRQKLEADYQKPQIIQTVRGLGYKVGG